MATQTIDGLQEAGAVTVTSQFPQHDTSGPGTDQKITGQQILDFVETNLNTVSGPLSSVSHGLASYLNTGGEIIESISDITVDSFGGLNNVKSITGAPGTLSTSGHVLSITTLDGLLSGSGGLILFTAGNGGPNGGKGGDISFTPGDGIFTNTNGGNIYLYGGNPNGSGIVGKILPQTIIDMGSNTLTGLSNGVNPTDAVAFSQISNHVNGPGSSTIHGLVSYLDTTGKNIESVSTITVGGLLGGDLNNVINIIGAPGNLSTTAKAINIQALDGLLSGNGGEIDINAGSGGASGGNGGDIVLTAGAGTFGNTNGGNIYLNGGEPSGSGTHGTIFAMDDISGNPFDNSNLNIYTPGSIDTADINIFTSSGSGLVGRINLTTGNSLGGTSGGDINVIAGNGFGDFGGQVLIQSGSGVSGGSAIVLQTGSGTSGNTNGAGLYLRTGSGSGFGIAGKIFPQATMDMGNNILTGLPNAINPTDAVAYDQLTDFITSPFFTGAAIIQADVTANTGSSYTIDQENGASFNLTMNAATPTITLQTAPTSGKYQLLYVRLIQDGTGGRAPTFANVTWASGSAPTIAQPIGAITYLTFAGNGTVWTGFAASQNLGLTTGSTPTTGYIGETLTASLASGSPIALTTATVTEICSVAYTAGNWMVSGNPTFIGTVLTATELQTLFATASGTSTTGQNTFNTSFATPPAAAATQRATAAIPSWPFNPTTSGTLYMKAKATFTGTSCTAFGGFTMERVS